MKTLILILVVAIFSACGDAPRPNNSTNTNTNTVTSKATVSGQVLDAEGRAIRAATVSLKSPSGVSVSAVTSTLGYYSFDNVETNKTYSASVAHKAYTFEEQTFNVEGNTTINFKAN